MFSKSERIILPAESSPINVMNSELLSPSFWMHSKMFRPTPPGVISARPGFEVFETNFVFVFPTKSRLLPPTTTTFCSSELDFRKLFEFVRRDSCAAIWAPMAALFLMRAMSVKIYELANVVVYEASYLSERNLLH